MHMPNEAYILVEDLVDMSSTASTRHCHHRSRFSRLTTWPQVLFQAIVRENFARSMSG